LMRWMLLVGLGSMMVRVVITKSREVSTGLLLIVWDVSHHR
jgi:hypothetical protein